MITSQIVSSGEHLPHLGPNLYTVLQKCNFLQRYNIVYMTDYFKIICSMFLQDLSNQPTNDFLTKMLTLNIVGKYLLQEIVRAPERESLHFVCIFVVVELCRFFLNNYVSSGKYRLAWLGFPLV